MIRDLSVMIAGKAGDGVLFTGNVLARLLKRHGWEVASYRDFPSNIRGEATSNTIRALAGRRDQFGLDVLYLEDRPSFDRLVIPGPSRPLGLADLSVDRPRLQKIMEKFR